MTWQKCGYYAYKIAYVYSQQQAKFEIMKTALLSHFGLYIC